ncbi:MAG: UMP kinase [Spirochaetota bacterium]
MADVSPQWLVIDLGGAIIAPKDCHGPDAPFASRLLDFLYDWLLRDDRRYLGLVVGGGATARRYQQALPNGLPNEDRDCLGIRATQLNAEYLRLLAASRPQLGGRSLVRQPLLTQYERLPPVNELGRIVVGGGWKPGFSTDYDSVLLARHVGAKSLLCLSNIAQIYDDDPAGNPQAAPFSHLDWETYQKMIGQEWVPGRSMPFDPIATKHAAKMGMELIFADGRDLHNLAKILNEEDFVGTRIR